MVVEADDYGINTYIGIGLEASRPYSSESGQAAVDWTITSFGLCLSKLRAECATTVQEVRDEFHMALASRDAALLSLTTKVAFTDILFDFYWFAEEKGWGGS